MINFDEKQTKRLSGTLTARQRQPTNARTAAHFTTMVGDYSTQRAVVPTGYTTRATRTMNRDGVPKALKANVGGAS